MRILNVGRAFEGICIIDRSPGFSNNGFTLADNRRLFEDALSEAMGQISDRGYGERYQGSGKAIYEAAFAFLGRGVLR